MPLLDTLGSYGDTSAAADRFEIRPPNATLRIALTAVGCAAFTAVGIALIISAESIDAILAGLLAVAFFGCFGMYAIPKALRRKVPMVLTREGIEHYKAFTDEAADLVIRYGGSLSGEHGDGQSRADLLPKMYGEELVQAFREFKSLWDPENRMNPGKVVDPYPRDANLRLGTDFRPPRVDTVFSFPEAQGPFDMLRCVGVGTCRRLHAGVMCPSSINAT